MSREPEIIEPAETTQIVQYDFTPEELLTAVVEEFEEPLKQRRSVADAERERLNREKEEAERLAREEEVRQAREAEEAKLRAEREAEERKLAEQRAEIEAREAALREQQARIEAEQRERERQDRERQDAQRREHEAMEAAARQKREAAEAKLRAQQEAVEAREREAAAERERIAEEQRQLEARQREQERIELARQEREERIVDALAVPLEAWIRIDPMGLALDDYDDPRVSARMREADEARAEQRAAANAYRLENLKPEKSRVIGYLRGLRDAPVPEVEDQELRNIMASVEGEIDDAIEAADEVGS